MLLLLHRKLLLLQLRLLHVKLLLLQLPRLHLELLLLQLLLHLLLLLEQVVLSLQSRDLSFERQLLLLDLKSRKRKCVN
jgi:hypothetical protein